MSASEAYFEAMYRDDADPYRVRTRWYEARKRAVLLSALPVRRFRCADEPGCGAGELTAELAARCDRLLASDFQPAAVASAQQRTAAWRHVKVVQHRLPQDWPASDDDVTDPWRGPFDLIVLSEVGYFLNAAEMTAVAAHCRASLAPDGTLVACDWRPEFRERSLSTHAVHRSLAGLGLSTLVRHEEADFLLQVWTQDPRSIAEREGIR